jgi:hypothetical protein
MSSIWLPAVTVVVALVIIVIGFFLVEYLRYRQLRKMADRQRQQLPPVSVLDEIVHDHKWYTPRKKSQRPGGRTP